MSETKQRVIPADLFNAVADPKSTRDTVAVIYADILRSHHGAGFDWGSLNRAILSRWTMSGLVYIKEKAWKIVEAKP